MNVRLLRKVQKQILAQPEAFDMTYVTNREDCGTVCCIAGWTCVLVGVPENRASMDVAQEILDLNTAQASRLFTTSEHEWRERWPKRFDRAYYRANDAKQKARIAARRIDHFIKTNGAE
jgi:hypothetical protein